MSKNHVQIGRLFEEVVNELFTKRYGCQITHIGGKGDKGVDLIGSKHGASFAIQCKKTVTSLGPSFLREFHSSILTKQKPNYLYDFGIFVTNHKTDKKNYTMAALKEINTFLTPMILLSLCEKTEVVSLEAISRRTYKDFHFDLVTREEDTFVHLSKQQNNELFNFRIQATKS